MQRIYLTKACDIWAVVDDQDYAYFSQWPWNIKRNKTGAMYARRAIRIGESVYTVYLHREILQLAQPRKRYPIRWACHADGNTLNCCRYNLEWLKPIKNVVVHGGTRAISQLIAV